MRSYLSKHLMQKEQRVAQQASFPFLVGRDWGEAVNVTRLAQRGVVSERRGRAGRGPFGHMTVTAERRTTRPWGRIVWCWPHYSLRTATTPRHRLATYDSLCRVSIALESILIGSARWPAVSTWRRCGAGDGLCVLFLFSCSSSCPPLWQNKCCRLHCWR